MCRCRLDEIEKLRLQYLQTYGCSRRKKEKEMGLLFLFFQNNISVCVRRCRVRLALLGNDFEQNVHEYRCLSLFEIDENVDGDDIGVNGR